MARGALDYLSQRAYGSRLAPPSLTAALNVDLWLQGLALAPLKFERGIRAFLPPPQPRLGQLF